MDNLNKKSKKKQIPLKCEICDKEFKNNIGVRCHIKYQYCPQVDERTSM